MTEVLVTAVKHLASCFDGMVADHTAESFSCSEVEALADVFRAIGNNALAEEWIGSHADGDDCGDMHHECEECEDWDGE
ncbi:hypothetical protein ACWF99_23730 [Nocardia sp. NPDC055002]